MTEARPDPTKRTRRNDPDNPAWIRHVQGDGPPQLTIDGGEVTSRRATATSHGAPPLTAAQNRILHRIREQGYIRSVEAGVFIHEARGKRCARFGGAGQDRFKGTERAISCCAYASADGNSAMKRLADRGFVTRGKQAGHWYAAAAE